MEATCLLEHEQEEEGYRSKARESEPQPLVPS
jgi:hypothetical protein